MNNNKHSNKFGITLVVLSISFLVMFSLVSAATGLITNTSLNNSRVNGASYLIYVNVTECASNCGIGNVTFYWSWHNGTQVNLSTNNNNSVNDTVFSYSWDSTALDDTNNGTINFTSYNYVIGGINRTNATTGLDLDNGFPTATLDSATFSTGSRIPTTSSNFALGINADNTIGLNSCLAYFTNTQNSTVYSTALTVTSNACSSSTLTSASIGLPRGKTYNTVVQVTDGNGNQTNSSDRAITVAGLSGTPQQVIVESDIDNNKGISESFKNFFEQIGNGFGNMISAIKNIFNS